MSNNNINPHLVSNDPWQRTVENPQMPPPSAPLAYPSSGAHQHLPVRSTISGAVAQQHPNSANIFLRDLPSHCYVLPRVTLNFTIVEILVFFPHWFKNKAICERLMNNDLTAQVHFMIMDEHRNLQLDDAHQQDRARGVLTGSYRKTMRSVFPGWTKAKHAAPVDWDPMSIAIGGFVPDDASLSGFRGPPAIPFRDLMRGVKKAPEGAHTGDLTRALMFALSVPETFMFPDDLANILVHVGRTQVTLAHTDRAIVRQYVERKNAENDRKKYLSPKKSKDHGGVDRLLAPVQGEGAREVPGGTMTWTQGQMLPPPSSLQSHPVLGLQQTAQAALQIMSSEDEGQSAGQQFQPPAGPSREELELDALLREYLDHDVIEPATAPAGPNYASGYLLRDCIEGNVAFDGSPLARAARFAQRPGQADNLWTVAQVPWIVQLLDAAQSELSS